MYDHSSELAPLARALELTRTGRYVFVFCNRSKASPNETIESWPQVFSEADCCFDYGVPFCKIEESRHPSNFFLP